MSKEQEPELEPSEHSAENQSRSRDTPPPEMDPESSIDFLLRVPDFISDTLWVSDNSRLVIAREGWGGRE